VFESRRPDHAHPSAITSAAPHGALQWHPERPVPLLTSSTRFGQREVELADDEEDDDDRPVAMGEPSRQVARCPALLLIVRPLTITPAVALAVPQPVRLVSAEFSAAS
jgi:hypothetical protein